MKLELANRTIFELLKEAHAKGEMIVTNERQRRLGKTKALMLFAEINQLPVIVRERQKKYYQKKYPNVHIFGHAEVTYIAGLPLMLLCDEGVPKRTIEELKTECHGVSGFLNEYRDVNEYATTVAGFDPATPKRDFSSLTVEKIFETPLLKIELDEIDSAPSIFYKGEKIIDRVAVDFEWRTEESDKIGSAYIRIKHGKEINGMLTVDTKEIAFGERAYR
ncbi:hypothetical protein [Bacillus velezensis]|uniref:hypothetical protein n=1 Tax=Bacillus velezensis TaxID=492670 RepID=UPI0011195C30|nr:hypothetical protein [Bacillus velezensis]MEC1106229.1 hypothetical protein [Bacillus velezensis]